MLEVAKHPSPPGKGGPSGRLRRQADRGHGPAPAPQRAGTDDRGRPAPWHREDHQQPGGTAQGDRPGRRAPESRPGGHVRVVLGGGHPRSGRRRGAPGAPAGVKAFTYRRVKNDERDAADLADLRRLGRLPEAWIAPQDVRELRELTRYRHKLVHLRTSCKDQVHGVLAKLGVEVTCSDIFGVAGSAWLDGLRLPQPYAGNVTSLRQLAGELSTEITMLGEVIADLLAGHRGYQVIQQLPGIGPVLAAVITAEIGDVTRFKNAGQLCSWAGLTPRHRESDTKVRGHVTKQGSRLLRFSSALAVFGGTRVAVGLRCWEATRLTRFRHKRQRRGGSRTAQAAGPLAR